METDLLGIISSFFDWYYFTYIHDLYWSTLSLLGLNEFDTVSIEFLCELCHIWHWECFDGPVPSEMLVLFLVLLLDCIYYSLPKSMQHNMEYYNIEYYTLV